MTETQPYSNHKANPIYTDDFVEELHLKMKEFVDNFEEPKDSLEEISLKIAAKTRELSDLYNEFNQKLVKFKANKF